MRLLIGNKNYSSWSLRPWLAMTVAGIPFEEVLVPLDTPEFKERVGAISGSGKVPALSDGDVRVWESLAILEYLGERFPDAKLWPADPVARAHARAAAAEMHAGFQALRDECPMNLWRPIKARTLTDEARANVTRIDALWCEARTRFGAGGEFLYGAFSAADAMYAPVASRLQTYDIAVSAPAAAYRDMILNLPAFKAWKTAGVQEPWVLPQDEPDWPTVLRG